MASERPKRRQNSSEKCRIPSHFIQPVATWQSWNRLWQPENQFVKQNCGSPTFRQKNTTRTTFGDDLPTRGIPDWIQNLEQRWPPSEENLICNPAQSNISRDEKIIQVRGRVEKFFKATDPFFSQKKPSWRNWSSGILQREKDTRVRWHGNGFTAWSGEMLSLVLVFNTRWRRRRYSRRPWGVGVCRRWPAGRARRTESRWCRGTSLRERRPWLARSRRRPLRHWAPWRPWATKGSRAAARWRPSLAVHSCPPREHVYLPSWWIETLRMM